MELFAADVEDLLLLLVIEVILLRLLALFDFADDPDVMADLMLPSVVPDVPGGDPDTADGPLAADEGTLDADLTFDVEFVPWVTRSELGVFNVRPVPVSDCSYRFRSLAFRRQMSQMMNKSNSKKSMPRRIQSHSRLVLSSESGATGFSVISASWNILIGTRPKIRFFHFLPAAGDN